MTTAAGAALEIVFAWLLRSSLQASLLILVILLVRSLLGQRLSARWRSTLWLLVVVRLAMPWAPESGLSPYGAVTGILARPRSADAAATPPALERSAPRGEVLATATSVGQSGQTRSASVRPAPVVWLAGALAFALWLLVQTLATLRAFSGQRPVTDSAMLELLEDCKADLGIRTYLAIVETPRTKTPALLGFVRPKLLLPLGLLAVLDREQLRHVLLHELSHLKRHDVALNWLMALLQTLHWFNPLVWLALRQSRADMELACDELALARLPQDATRAYGHTLLELLRAWVRPRRLPTLAALAEDAAEMKNRMRWVAAFGNVRRASSLLSMGLVVVLGVLFLPDAGQPQPREPAAAESQRAPVVDSSAERAPTMTPAPAGDAVIDAAREWLALVDAGECGHAWEDAHSIVRGLLSRQAWSDLCEELRRIEAEERGHLVSRRVAMFELLPRLPENLGDGLSVRFTSRYDSGEHPGPRLLMARDSDGRWRLVRFDKE